MWAADELGLLEVFKEVEAAHAAGGTGSEPAPLLLELARSGGRFGTCDLARSGPPGRMRIGCQGDHGAGRGRWYGDGSGRSPRGLDGSDTEPASAAERIQ